MNKAVQQDTLYKLKNSLQEIESWMLEERKQGNLSLPSVFNHILESVVTERIRHLYKKHEKSIVEAFKTPFAGLMGLINNQILTAYEGMIEEIMDSVHRMNHMDEFFESIQLP